jgi:hypothetical protein
MKSLNYPLFTLICLSLLTSCVQKSNYNEALAEIDRLKQKEITLNNDIQQKNNLLAKYQTALQNSENEASNNLNNNTDKGKQELEFVKRSIDDIIYNVQNCTNADDLYQVKNNLESLNSKVGNFIFFNY